MSPTFDVEFHRRFTELLQWRRDVRHFKTDDVDAELIEAMLDAACLSPSVGNSQPWRFVRVDSAQNRETIYASFSEANDAAAAEYDDDEQLLYTKLKLQGIQEAPVQLAVYCDMGTHQGKGLGRQTMPEMLAYSVVCAVHSLWLAARMHGIGVGWVSILAPDAVNRILDVPKAWKLIAYLCVGYPKEETMQPELEKQGWQSREDACRKVVMR